MVDYDKLEGPKVDRRTATKLLGTAGFGGLTALAGCTGESKQNEAGGGSGGDGSGDSTPSPAKKMGGKIEAGWLTNELVNLDPHKVDKGVQMQVISNVFNGLLKYNEKGEIVGDVAKDWKIPNNTTYEFTIREGVTFHNGDKLDAQAVKWSLDRLRGMESSPHIGKVKPIESVEAPSSTKLVINLKEAVAPFITFLTIVPGRAGAIVNKTAIQEMGADKYNRKPVGSGPFKVTTRETGSSLTLTKFENYWETDGQGNQLPYLDEVKIRLIPSPSTLWSALRSGTVQFASSVPGQYGNKAKKSSQLDVQGVSPGNWSSLSLLANNPAEDPYNKYGKIASGSDTLKGADKWEGKTIPTSDPKVRKAISMALDRKAIVEKGYFGWAKEAHSLFNPAIGWLYEEEPDPGQYHDPEKAKQLLDEAGYTGDPRFSMKILGVPEDKRIMTVIQSQLSNVGIEAQLDIQQPSSYWTAIYQYTHTGQMYGGAGDVDPWMSWWRQLHTPVENGSAGGWQKNLYSNEEFDKLLEESYRTPKQSERKDIIRKAEKIFVEDAPYAMTAFTLLPKPSSSSLKDVRVPVGMSNFHQAYLTE